MKIFGAVSSISKSEAETKRIAKKFLEKHLADLRERPLIILLEGKLGVGKTVFVKGIGEALGVADVISPTFVIRHDYENFYHFDLYRIEDLEEFKHLGIKEVLEPGNVVCIEWGEKIEPIQDYLKNKGKVVYVKMEYVSEVERAISTS